MKYNLNNKPLQCMMTQSNCYKGTKKMTVKGILWHSTGANNPWLKRYVQPDDNDPNKSKLLSMLGINSYKNDWNHISIKVGLNCWIGKLANGNVATVQTMPWDYKPWGCGEGSKGSCNNGWIQFEICEDNLNDKNYFDGIYKEACEITAYLCEMYKLDPCGSVTVNGVKIPTILCHADSYKLGMGSNHGDVLHWFSKHGKTMDDVRKDVSLLMKNSGNSSNSSASIVYRVRKSLNDSKTQIGAFESLSNAKSLADKNIGYNVYDNLGNCVYSTIQNSNIIKKWQNAAIADGYKFQKYGADGKWGSECVYIANKAICQYKDGVYENKNLTKFIQSILDITVDGKFGVITKKAVIDYQKRKGLKADGIVGFKTWKKLINIK